MASGGDQSIGVEEQDELALGDPERLVVGRAVADVASVANQPHRREFLGRARAAVPGCVIDDEDLGFGDGRPRREALAE